MQNAEVSGDGYFDSWVDASVIESDYARGVIKDIENGDVISKYNVVIPIYGSVSPERLSGGVKSLLSMYANDDVIFDLASIGDNCFKQLGILASLKDIEMCSDSFRPLYRNGFEGDILVKNTHNIISNDNDLYEEWWGYYFGR